MRRFVIFAFVIAVLLTVATGASAQGQQPRLYRGLFGSSRGALDQQLALNLSLGSGYDWNVLVGDQGISGQNIAPDTSRSAFETGAATLTYSLNKSRAHLGASAGTAAVYYPVLDKPMVPSYQGGIRGSFELWKGASLSGTQDISYQPFYQMSWLGGTAAPQAGPLGNIVGLNQGLTTLLENHTTVRSAATLRQSLTTRISASAGYDYTRTDSSSGLRDLESRGGRGDISYGITRYLSLRLGYAYFDHRFTGATTQSQYKNQSFDGGVDFNKALQLTRSLSLRFGTGLIAVSGTPISTTTAGATHQNFYSVVGDAVLEQDLGRTWNIGLAYNRNVHFDQAFQSPVSNDSLSLTLGGLINRRVQVVSNAGTSQGNIGLPRTSSNGFSNFYVRAGVAAALTKALAVTADYSFFRYRFDTAPLMSTGFAGVGNRQVVRVNMSMFVPLFERAKKGNAGL